MTVSAKAPKGGRTIPESQTPDRDYPQMVGQRGLVQPPHAEYGAMSTGHSYSIRPAPITCGRSPTTHSITCPWATFVWSICMTRTTSRNCSLAPHACFR